jgi:hypothetical protein
MGRDHGIAAVDDLALDADVERQRQPVGAEPVEERGEGGGIIDREAADDDPRNPGVEQGGNMRRGADSAGDLQLERGGFGEVSASAGASA